MRSVSQAKVREILYKYSIGQNLHGEDYDDILSVFMRHPRSIEKTGHGIESISVGGGSFGSRCFFINRTDGTMVDFSYKKCFSKSVNDFPKAARVAVADSIADFKMRLPAGSFPCPINGEETYTFNCHIDHAPPNTFRKIVEDYLFIRNVDLGKVEYDRSSFGVSFVDQALAADFKEFHDAKAQLRAVSEKGNLSLPKL